MTHSELAAAHDAEDFPLLWREAVPLAQYALRKMTRQGHLQLRFLRDDLMQEAIATAGEAIRSWNPIEGAFSTWIVSAVRGAILQYIAREIEGMQQISLYTGYDDSEEDDRIETRLEGSIAYETAPEGLNEPIIELQRLEQSGEITALLGRLSDPEDQDMICRLYGLDCEKQGLEQYSTEHGISPRTVQRRLRRALRFLGQFR